MSGSGSRPARRPADRTAGTASPGIDRLGDPPALRHGAERAGSVGPYNADDRHAGGRGDVQRAAIAADVQRRTVEQRAQFLQRELATRQDSLRGVRRAVPRGSAKRSAASVRGPDVMTMRRRGSGGQRAIARRNAAGHRRNGLPALTCMTTSRSPPATPARSDDRRRRGGGGVHRHLDRIAGGSGGAISSGRAGPIGSRRNDAARSSRGRATRSCTSSSAGDLVADPARAPLSQVSSDARGPP